MFIVDTIQIIFLYLYNNVKFTLLYNINTKIKSTRIFSNAFCLTLIQKCFSTHRPKSELAEYPRYLYPALLSYHKFRQRQLVIPPFKSSIYFVYLKSVYFYSAFQSYFCWMDYKKLLYSIYGCCHNGRRLVLLRRDCDSPIT